MQSRRLFSAIVGIGLFAMAARGVTDPDVWWHLKTGQLTLHNHAVFRVDPYSFTRLGQPWVNHEWLFDVLLFDLYRLTGWGGLMVVFAAITSASFALSLRRSSAELHVKGIVVVLAAIASSPLWGVRPQMVSLLFASLLLVLRDRSHGHPGRLWWTLPLIFVWVNLHGGYALGIALLILFLIGDLMDVAVGAVQWKQAEPRIRTTALVLIACLMVVPLNPYGMKMYTYPLATLHSSAMQAFIVEWFSPNFHEASYRPFLLLFLAMLAALALSPKRLPPSDLLLILATVSAALVSVRHIPIFVVIAAPLLSDLVQPWFRKPGSAQVFQPSKPKFALSIAMLLLMIVLAGVKIRQLVTKQSEAEATTFPAAAASFLQHEPLQGAIFNSYNWGGFLIWKLYPEYRVYIDGRADVYGDRVMQDFANSYYLTGNWRDPLDSRHVQTLVLPPDAPLLTVLGRNRSWTRVYSDPQSVVLTRNHSLPIPISN